MTTAASSRRKIPAFDGLRAVAVVMVLLYHADPDILPGGFLGVDVFFVLSGYLITGVLLRDLASTGFPHLGRFWMRRARRLLPALWAMLAVVAAVLLCLPGDLRVNLSRQMLGALTYSSNWVSIVAQDDYFDRTSPSIFLHLWSLAIEEQFYLVWPLIVLLLVTLFPRHRWGRSVAALVLALASAGFMAGLSLAGADPNRLYYGTDTHAFGLLLGAALAFVLPMEVIGRGLASAPGKAATGIAGGGALMLLVGIAATLPDESPAAYRGGIFAASLAAALLLVTAADERTLLSRALSLPPLVWLGRRSYGFYLWHWPAVVVLLYLWPAGADGTAQRMAIVGIVLLLSILLCWASYRWLELPVMRRGFRGAARTFWGRLDGGRQVGGRAVGRIVSAAGVALVVVLAAASCLTSSSMSTLEVALRTAQEQFAPSSQALASASGRASSTEESSTPPSPPASAPSGSADPSSPGSLAPIEGDRMVAVGDSVMLAAADSLQRAFPGIVIDAQVSRQSSEVFDVTRGLAQQYPSRPVFIVGAGTNGTLDAGRLSAMVDDLGEQSSVILVNVYADRPWAADDNAAIDEVASTHRNVAVADWRDAAAANREDLYPDGIHPRPEGGQVYVQAVSDALHRLGFQDPSADPVP